MSMLLGLLKLEKLWAKILELLGVFWRSWREACRVSNTLTTGVEEDRSRQVCM